MNIYFSQSWWHFWNKLQNCPLKLHNNNNWALLTVQVPRSWKIIIHKSLVWLLIIKFFICHKRVTEISCKEIMGWQFQKQTSKFFVFSILKVLAVMKKFWLIVKTVSWSSGACCPVWAKILQQPILININ